ncbi:MAG: glycoside hydrolase family 65 protein [Thermoleophilia bacterium]
MTAPPVFTVEPWALRETRFDPALLPRSESLFALSNGHIGLRGNLDEGEPHGLPGTYLNAFYEIRPLPYAEGGYGYPDSGQTVINVTNGKIIRLMVDDEPFDIRYGTVHRHERELDFRAGTLGRVVEWTSPAGTGARVRSERLVSFTQRSVAAVLWEVEPLDRAIDVVVQSELVANEALPQAGESDPRAAAELASALRSDYVGRRDERVVLVHSTAHSNLRMGAAMDHEITTPDGARITTIAEEDLGRVTVTATLEPGQRLRIAKFIAYGWSSRRSEPAIRAQVEGALDEARRSGWAGLAADQRAFLDEYWECADVEVEGDDELQQAVRFAMFHVLQAGARVEQRAIAAKGLTGPGYDGHSFWDSEAYVLVPLTYTFPEAAGDALRWRHLALDLARERATTLKLKGAAFPWRTIRGSECSGYWPAGTAAFHVNADIAMAVSRYVAATGDVEFEREVGVDLMVETARLWMSLGHHDDDHGFRIDGVTGPDEYTAIVDNNVFTNLMAARNLRNAAAVAERHPAVAGGLGVGAAEIAAWRDAAACMSIPWDEELGVHPQSEGFTRHAVWDFANTTPDQYPLLLHMPYFQLYRTQVVKQADLVMALFLCGDSFTAEQKRADFDYYEPLTVRDSSLSAAIQAVVAAEVGYTDLAFDLTGEAVLLDLHDLAGNTRDGLHIASLAGSWIALVCGFGGMRDHDGALTFAPRLPDGIDRLAFRVRFRDSVLRVDVGPDEATYTLISGDAIETSHHGEPIRVAPGDPLRRVIAPVPDLVPPPEPPGREPRRRGRIAQAQNGRGNRMGIRYRQGVPGNA